MNAADPSRRGVTTRNGVKGAYGQDVLALLDRVGLDGPNDMETCLAHETGPGIPSPDQDVAANDLLQQARALTALDQDRMLAERITTGEGEFGLDLERPYPVVEARRVAVPWETWRRRWAFKVSRISQRFRIRSRMTTQQNQSQQRARNGAVSSQTWGRRLASVVGRVFGLQSVSRSSLANNKTTTSRTVNYSTAHECVICQDRIYGVEILAPCGHYYDIGCITALFQSATRDETLYPPRCCKEKIPFASVRPHLPQVLLATLQEKDAEFRTLNRVYCSSPTCNRFLGPLSRVIFISKVYTCPAPNCGRRTCGKCREQYTGGWKHECRRDADIAQVLELSRASGWVRCPGCSQMIELNMGCYHMTCRCRTEFCYLCRARWKKCQCPQWDERQLLAAAEERVGAELGVGRQQAARREVPVQRARPAPGLVPTTSLRRRERVVKRKGPARCATGLRPSTLTTPTRAVETTSTSAFVLAASSSSSPPPTSSASETAILSPRSAFQSAFVSSDGQIKWSDSRQQPLIREMMERLRADPECGHAKWCYRDGGGTCQHCGRHFPKHLFCCEGCKMLACNGCVRNRL